MRKALEIDPIGPVTGLGTYMNVVNLLDMCGITVLVSPKQDGRPGSVKLLSTSGQAAIGARLGTVVPHTLGAIGWAQEGSGIPNSQADIATSGANPFSKGCVDAELCRPLHAEH